MEILFWLFLFIIFYAYFGYGIILVAMVKVRDLFISERTIINPKFEPTVSFIIPCYNERSILKEKVENCLQLDYPADKLEIIFITDGSDDGSAEYLKTVSGVKVLHEPQRRGKSCS